MIRKWISWTLVAGSLVTLQAAGAAPSPEPSCAKKQTVLRKSPSASAPISWRAPKFTPFLRHETKSGFARVTDFEGESHWILAGDLTTTLSCVMVKAQVATLRREPSTSAQPAELKTLDKYTALKKLEVKAEWVKVEDEAGRQAWIHESNIWKPVKVQSVKF